MVYMIYIAAAVAVGLLIGFVTLSIIWLRKTVSGNIRSKTVGLLSVYDDLLEEKSRELAAVEKRIRQSEDSQAKETVEKEPPQAAPQPSTVPMKASEMLDMAERTGGAAYRDDAVGGLYQKIRSSFSFQLGEILPDLSGTPVSGGPAGRLLSELEFDTVFRLSTMPEEDQRSILRETLPEEDLPILNAYLESHPTFHMLDFYDNLRSLTDTEPKPVRIRVPAGMVADEVEQGGVQIIPDGDICEGFQLEDDNFLYDYCIKARELR